MKCDAAFLPKASLFTCLNAKLSHWVEREVVLV